MDKAIYEKVTKYAREVRHSLSVQMIVLYGSYAA